MSFNIADLPPEIVENIMARFVATVGIQQAWDYRKISPLFWAYIPREILGRQPLTAYRGQSNRSLLQSRLRQFLEHHMVASYGAPNDLPNLIKKIVDVFASVSDGMSFATRTKWTQGACHTVAKYCSAPSALTLATKPTPKMKAHLAGITGDVEALAVAVVLDDQGLVHRLLERGISMWAKTPLASSYTCAFNLAVLRNNIPMVKAMLAHEQSDLSSNEKRNRTTTIRSGIEQAIMKDDEMATELLHWCMTNTKNSSDSLTRNVWLETAWQHGRMGFLAELLNHARAPDMHEYRKRFLKKLYEFEAKPTYGTEHRHVSLKEIIGFFLQKGVFDRHTINIGQLYKGSSNSIHTIRRRSLLHIVVSMGDLDLVQAVLDAGAHPDGVRMHGGRLTYPLIAAVQKGRIDIVRVLIARGADPEAGDRETAGKRTTLVGLEEGGEMHREISEAISQKDRSRKPLFDEDEP